MKQILLGGSEGKKMNLLDGSALEHCLLCPRGCGVNRLEGARGVCGAGELVRIALVSKHLWEEPCLTGKNGAGTVFFSHCSLRCVFCQNAAISSEGQGIEVTPERLADIFLEQQQSGAATLDLVTPTHYAPQIAAALAAARKKGFCLPVVWNSSGYETVELVAALAEMVDVFLPDLKYYDAETAGRYSQAPDYFSAAAAAITAMAEQTGMPEVGAGGVLQRGVLVRHLILPGRRHESMRLLDWLWEQFGDRVWLSLMNQYTPLYRAAEFPEINRPLTTFEYQSVIEHALDIGITHCYVQEGKTASAKFVPAFDGRGVLPLKK
jgi:putative pyruvate formate lyase activating enzyme